MKAGFALGAMLTSRTYSETALVDKTAGTGCSTLHHGHGLLQYCTFGVNERKEPGPVTLKTVLDEAVQNLLIFKFTIFCIIIVEGIPDLGWGRGVCMPLLTYEVERTALSQLSPSTYEWG